jgi:hypothetical protein
MSTEKFPEKIFRHGDFSQFAPKRRIERCLRASCAGKTFVSKLLSLRAHSNEEGRTFVCEGKEDRPDIRLIASGRPLNVAVLTLPALQVS